MVKLLRPTKGLVGSEPLTASTSWPNANARLLGLGAGLPVDPLDRLAQFSAPDFERFTLEWASDYLAQLEDVDEVQQRGGAGDKGRDVIVWLDSSEVVRRRWRLYQCKHYGTRLGTAAGIAEIGKVLYYTLRGDYTIPEEYWFVTHQGVVGPLQDLLDDPNKMRQHVLDHWEEQCATQIMKAPIPLTAELRAHISSFPFSIFRAKQPIEIINEHAKTRFHLTVFGLPLINRPKPPAPPSAVSASEIGYITQLYAVIGENLGMQVTQSADFAAHASLKKLFDRSRITFYCAENLKELARDQMADTAFFDSLVDEFCDALYHVCNEMADSGLKKMRSTILAAQSLQLGGHALAPHVVANDREGICHHMANENRVIWCEL
ncbi:ABC-three component system protein [Yersinia enterocolitica]